MRAPILSRLPGFCSEARCCERILWQTDDRASGLHGKAFMAFSTDIAGFQHLLGGAATGSIHLAARR
jgi:hypothetical protein